MPGVPKRGRHDGLLGDSGVTPWNAAQSFNFFPVPTDIHFGFGVVRTLAEHVRSFGADRVFLVTDPGIRSAGLLDSV